MNAVAMLLTTGAVAVLISVLLSLWWHRVDTKVEQYYDAKSAFEQLNSKRPHPSEAAEVEEELERLAQVMARLKWWLPWSDRIRSSGLVLLYSGTILSSMGVLIWGVLSFS